MFDTHVRAGAVSTFETRHAQKWAHRRRIVSPFGVC